MLFCVSDQDQQLETSGICYYTMESTSELTTPPPPFAISGSRACGKVVYHRSTLPLSIILCHCSEFRKTFDAFSLAFDPFYNTTLQWASFSTDSESPIRITFFQISDRALRWQSARPVKNAIRH